MFLQLHGAADNNPIYININEVVAIEVATLEERVSFPEAHTILRATNQGGRGYVVTETITEIISAMSATNNVIKVEKTRFGKV